ncbi:DUF732 domain-containing protein [Mycolicibacterium flavescens]|uniref:DUF732 domain-containing protein n=1 Tax=Mycolicibacterium flavescens TaxID=1776 RepID=A0A1E3RJM6_MYCFV|nr:DUF732 domain-containing protein [Mycolicibacterium flavescens]MCV7282182.1 DUF732 domain-containing protein [Mycolicibacterium flavescens]ODQ89672.1 hypothetical protein BHQ18_14175 [Mycolicibacterium flavescens]
MLKLTCAAAAAAVAAIVSAPGAAAQEDDYLAGLEDRYRFLTAEQMLTEGYRVCALTSAGALSPDAAAMVMRDLEVSVGPAMDIVSGAVLNLC